MKEKFFRLYAEQIVELCEKMAGRFQAGRAGQRNAAAPVTGNMAVFIHPIIDKRRAAGAGARFGKP